MTVAIASPSLLTTEEAADFLHVAPQTLNLWRCTNRYPLPFVRIGRAVRYRREDLERFIAQNTVGAREE